MASHFFGTVPYLPELGLPEEDSVDFKDGLMETVRGEGGDVLDIALIDLPHVSNFTDLDALRIEPDAHVRKVTKVSDLGIPDAVILPGSKMSLMTSHTCNRPVLMSQSKNWLRTAKRRLSVYAAVIS